MSAEPATWSPVIATTYSQVLSRNFWPGTRRIDRPVAEHLIRQAEIAARSYDVSATTSGVIDVGGTASSSAQLHATTD
jgi:hypothetical protein